jgi:NADH-quinone oxidoreductase subunit E
MDIPGTFWQPARRTEDRRHEAQMLRRLHPEQPESFAFTPENLAWARAQITKYPEGRQASAIIPLLWRAQEQEGWLSRPAIEYVCDMLGMAHIRGLEVATFYFMFQLQPVGSVAHVQVCGTTSCMICGAEDLIGVCKEKIARQPHKLSKDGRFSWEEVECLGACANAPMVQIGKDYYEDLTAERLGWIIDEMAAGRVPTPGPQNGRYASEPASGLTSLAEHEAGRDPLNASARLASDIGDTIRRIDGTEVPLRTPWGRQSDDVDHVEPTPKRPVLAEDVPADDTGIDRRQAPVQGKGHPESYAPAAAAEETARETHGGEAEPERLEGPRPGRDADDLKRIDGIGPKIEGMLHEMGIWHFDQIAAWTPAEVAWVDSRLKFRGRIEREGWIAQAKALASEG